MGSPPIAIDLTPPAPLILGGVGQQACASSEADGGFAKYVVVPAANAHDVTDSPLSDEQLACLPVAYVTALGLLERAGVSAGETLLVTGASGGVGLALVQLAAACGADVVAVSSADKAGPIRVAGAMAVVSLHKGDLAGQVAGIAPSGLDAVPTSRAAVDREPSAPGARRRALGHRWRRGRTGGLLRSTEALSTQPAPRRSDCRSAKPGPGVLRPVRSAR